MSTPHPAGPFCQSCGMPLVEPKDFGTGKNGIRVNDYCAYCYADGAFTKPGMTMEEMTDICVDALVKQGMPATNARTLMAATLPMLKRWRAAAGAGAGV
ncbi:MAG: zinc ribbon domain-containing protein [Gemmatimonadota bacterium]|nr:zinc ribbon domain-containing protein [Gemmatimonadota bacterium]MDE3127145.1 zinc ribbon domain-containing protein [Gemmatimonadota bacterium]MDE3172337.1 zinc ribbon domain-containing protein [Gemmatimonadota bacterium]MDE3215780.1 zinc ribbon domain-containing protein [Gemmatimonadota bacterium]